MRYEREQVSVLIRINMKKSVKHAQSLGAVSGASGPACPTVELARLAGSRDPRGI